VANSINGFSGNGAPSVETKRTTQQPARNTSLASTSNPSAQGGGDQVRITSTASRLAALGKAITGLSPIDSSRVARLTQAVADGTYTISAEHIASGLLRSEHALAQIGL
jgi:negative regulator of flagellin synthesis FlgM